MRLNYGYFASRFDENNSCINKLYEEIIDITTSSESFVSFQEYSTTIEFLVKNYILYNDYLHSNNLLQLFRINCLLKDKKVENYDWFLYYSIKIYSKRAIKYYLDNPSVFWNTIESLNKSKFEKQLGSLIIEILEFYKKVYVNYPKFLQESMKKFVEDYINNKSYSNTIDAHIKELKKLISTNDEKEVEEIYKKLESQQNIDNDNVYTNIEKKYYDNIELVNDIDHNKKIMIIGDNPFVHNKNIIFGIAKTYNIQKEQFEFFIDYEKIKNEGERIINKAQYNSNYIGMIFGSIPHSTSGKNEYSNLLSKVKSEPGFPFVVECKTEGKELKITKSNFKMALREIIINYKSK